MWNYFTYCVFIFFSLCNEQKKKDHGCGPCTILILKTIQASSEGKITLLESTVGW